MYSFFLVTLQFSSIAAFIILFPVPHTVGPVVLFVLGSVLGAASVISMRWDNLRIFPEPKKGFRLVTTGPYRYIRHPMYTSVLLMMSAFVLQTPSVLSLLLWLQLLAALIGKVRIEERLIPLHFPDYASYRQRTRKLVPYIY